MAVPGSMNGYAMAGAQPTANAPMFGKKPKMGLKKPKMPKMAAKPAVKMPALPQMAPPPMKQGFPNMP